MAATPPERAAAGSGPIEIVHQTAERSVRAHGPAAGAWLDVIEDGPVTDGVPPSWSDRFVRASSQRLGGPLGRRADTIGRWWTPVRWTLLVATVVYLLGVGFRLKCRITVAGESVDHFRWMCYSDIGILYQLRGLMQGNVPYLDSGDYQVLEYPVLTGWFLQLLRVISTALGAPTGANLTAQQQVDSTLTFVDVNTVVLGALLLVAVWAQARSVPHRPWDAIMVAASPCVAATALINWDLLPVALTALGVLCWARRRPGWAGVFWGLGMAAKLYPLFLLGPLLLLCLRSDRLREFGRMLLAFAVSWFVVNLPAIWLALDSWLSFWTFNSDRSGDLGSIWYVLSLAGHPVENLNRLALVIFGLLCLGIAALILVAPRRPRMGQVMFLVVAAFLLTNKVYSPQYVLWLLPFVVLARPVWRDWLIFTVGELGYFAAIWWHLGGLLAPGGDGPDKVYWLAVSVRMAAELWIVIIVVRDIWRPEHDVVRHPPGMAEAYDDPTGGVLDEAPDVAWLPLGPKSAADSAGTGGTRGTAGTRAAGAAGTAAGVAAVVPVPVQRKVRFPSLDGESGADGAAVPRKPSSDGKRGGSEGAVPQTPSSDGKRDGPGAGVPQTPSSDGKRDGPEAAVPQTPSSDGKRDAPAAASPHAPTAESDPADKPEQTSP